MKAKPRNGEIDELRAEYDLGKLLRKGVQGKYAERYREGTNVVLLAPDVAEVFSTDEAVNEALRLVIRQRKLTGVGKKAPAKA